MRSLAHFVVNHAQRDTGALVLIIGLYSVMRACTQPWVLPIARIVLLDITVLQA
jgi:hypothetical protein